MNLLYDLTERVNDAIFRKEAMVIVEGKDDRQIYSMKGWQNRLV